MIPSDWLPIGSEISRHIDAEAAATLAAYRVQPNLILEHVGIEDEVLSGGYGHRQLHELIQNAADALLEGKSDGRVCLVLTNSALYCANEGAPIDVGGVTAILHSHISRKRGSQIGQFGLGFKSVLAVSDAPEFYSRTGSFGFSASWAGERIRAVVPSAERTPFLRLARTIDPVGAAAGDAVLRDLMQWATTVIRLPRDCAKTMWLSHDCEEFPREFVLFAPQVASLHLEDRTTGVSRHIRAVSSDGAITVREGSTDSTWRVFARSVAMTSLSPEAMADADRKTRGREALPLLWAVPTAGSRGRGRSWAFFPTETVTSLRGILNAPWKTNADRQNLLDGPFNRLLLQVAAELVVDSIPALLGKEDPGAVLDVLPARAEDAANWADLDLAERIPSLLSERKCLPDTAAELQKPGHLRTRPAEQRTASDRKAWNPPEGVEGAGWVHLSVETRERRPRAQKLGAVEATVRQWLESIARHGGVEGSRQALLAINVLRDSLSPWETPQLRDVQAIATCTEGLVSANLPGLFVGGDDTSTPEAFRQVHPRLLQDPEVVDVLDYFGIASGRVAADLSAVLARHPVDWSRVWGLARRLGADQAKEILGSFEQLGGVQCCNADGVFRPIRSSLLPGAIARLDEPGDAGVAIDEAYHSEDLQLLEALGATEVPIESISSWQEPWAADYRKERTADFYQRNTGRNRPKESSLAFSFLDRDSDCGPLQPMLRLSKASRARMTKWLLPRANQEGQWSVGTKVRASSYKKVDGIGPIAWFLKQHGVLEASTGTSPTSLCVDYSLSPWSRLLPVVFGAGPDIDFLGLPQTLEQLTHSHWEYGFGRALADADLALSRKFYAAACEYTSAPKDLLVRHMGKRATAAASIVTVAVGEREDLQAEGLSVLEVDSDREARALIERWGLRSAVSATLFDPIGVPSRLLDFFPGLTSYLSAEARAFVLQECEHIIDDGKMTQFGMDGDVFLFRSGTPPEVILAFVVRQLGLALGPAEQAIVLGRDTPAELEALSQAIRRQPTIVSKIATLFTVDQLLSGLPAAVVEAVEAAQGRGLDLSADEMALAVHGVEILRVYSHCLEAKGMTVPTRWSGSARAQEFVDSLGFPVEFAGFERIAREPAIEVDGPLKLKPLHDFQREIAGRILAALSEAQPARGLVSLPTGSGKTRVAVEALVKAIVDGRFGRRCVVWIAQSDELCEQAVQSWAQVWRASGTSGRLLISRMWGSTNNRVASAPEKFHVVVATFQTLRDRISWPAYAWLRDAACVVIDEAHGAIAPSYTWILEQFGLTAHTTSRPLLGLTATPFRGSWAEEETQRLVNRFGARRFDIDAIPGLDPYPVLQERRILARVDHQLLEGATISLTESERASVDQFKVLPSSAEARLGTDAGRNDRIVESIKALPDEWPVLVFATSVEHARLLAALLSVSGVVTRAITGDMEVAARRHYVEEFKRGRIRALTNYGVLTTGFDAPAVRAIYLARPVFSPVLYQQMIGRGLRGPENGGKERCLLVNIADNVLQYGEQLAFRHFERLWLETGQ